MKFGIISDTHTIHEPPKDDVLFWLHAGDLYDYILSLKKHSAWLEKKMYVVRGNHDIKDEHGIFDAQRDLTGKIKRVDDYWLVGIGWAQGINQTPTELGLSIVCGDVFKQCARMIEKNDKVILVSHYPPRIPKVLDPEDIEHSFYTCVYEMIDELKPILVVTGHCHTEFGKTYRYKESTIVFPSWRGMIAEVEGKTVSCKPCEYTPRTRI